MRHHTTRGVIHTGVAQAIKLLVQIGSVVLLSRLLMPSEFGLMAMAGPILGFTMLFQDLGLTQATIQRPVIAQSGISALFWFSVAISTGLSLLLVILSPVVSWFYGTPEVGHITAAMGLLMLLAGCGAQHTALLNRQMRFGNLAMIDVGSAAGGLIVSVVCALIFHSVWSLYAGSLATSLISVVSVWVVSGWRPSPPRKDKDALDMLRFGSHVTGFNIANFFARNLDNVLIGHRWGDQPLGLYDRAYKLLLAPLQQINQPISKVMLPVLSRLAGEPDRYRHAFLRAMAQLLLLAIPGIAFMVATSDLLVPVLLGKQWTGAAGIFAVLGIAGFAQVLNNPSGWLFISQSRTKDYAYWGFFSAVTSVISFIVGLPHGPIGVATAYAVVEYIRTPILWGFVTRHGAVRPRDIVKLTAPYCFVASASVSAIFGVKYLLADESPFIVLAASLAVSYLAALIVLALFPAGRATLGQTFGLAKSVVPSRKPHIVAEA